MKDLYCKKIKTVKKKMRKILEGVKTSNTHGLDNWHCVNVFHSKGNLQIQGNLKNNSNTIFHRHR